ncbi:MAG: HAD family hydrolase [Firmicutes bacterium]|nr:HAD family hydrolase [Bacillota bacterium]
MVKYLLFDLDGTLLPLDTDHFIASYIRSISGFFSHLIDPRRFGKQLIESCYAMINNLDPTLTNEQKFMADFFVKLELAPTEMMPLFDTYYRERYQEVRETVSPSPLARQIVETALGKGMRVVLATNPIFPRVAIKQRMQWAGIADLPWELITTYEDAHFCKPHPQYYSEILQRLNAQPHECIHIGNDADEDMAAQAAGIPVVMVEDCLINRQNKTLSDCYFKGDLATVAEWLASK